MMAVAIVIAIILIDQAIKIWVKTGMYLHESIHIFDWWQILFIENNGMAFGMEIGSKLFLSLFRIVAVGAIGWYVWKLVKAKASNGYIACLSMVMAGAAGNIFDCVFYGQIFSESTSWTLSQFVPFGEGYAPLFMGKVVDMFYFPLFGFDWPEWMPWVGGEHFIFFSPVFNFADAAISVGVVLLLIFHRKRLNEITFVSDDVREEQTTEQSANDKKK